MQSIEDYINIEKRALGQYLKHNEDEWLKTAWNETLICVDEEPYLYKERVTSQRKEE